MTPVVSTDRPSSTPYTWNCDTKKSAKMANRVYFYTVPVTENYWDVDGSMMQAHVLLFEVTIYRVSVLPLPALHP